MRRRIGLANAFIEPSANDFPFNHNHGPDRNLIQLEGPSGLRKGFRHKGRVNQLCFLKPMIALHFQICCSRLCNVIAARKNRGRRSRPKFRDFWILAFAGMTETRRLSLVS